MEYLFIYLSYVPVFVCSPVSFCSSFLACGHRLFFRFGGLLCPLGSAANWLLVYWASREDRKAKRGSNTGSRNTNTTKQKQSERTRREKKTKGDQTNEERGGEQGNDSKTIERDRDTKKNNKTCTYRGIALKCIHRATVLN